MKTLRFALASTLFLFLFGCPTPQSSSRPTGSVELRLANPSRTVSADWTNLIQSYHATFHCVSNSFGDVTGNVSGSTTLVVSGIRTGTWNIVVEAWDAASTVVAKGELLGTVLDANAPISISIPLAPTQIGTGSYSFTLDFPLLSLDASPVALTKIMGQLSHLDGTPVGTPFDIIDTAFTDLGGGISEAVFAGTNVPSGPYRLTLTLYRDAIPVKYVREAINIWDNVESDSWIDPAGAAQTARALTTADFSLMNADLASLDVTVDGVPQTPVPGFSAAVTSYTLEVASASLTQSLDLTANISVPGQSIEVSIDGGSTWAALASGTGEFTLNKGSNSLQIRVTANIDGIAQAQKTYSLTISKIVSVSGLTLTPSTLDLPTDTLGNLTAQVAPVEANNQGVSFSSSDTNLATVDPDGTIHPLLPGVVTITATSDEGGFSRTCLVTLVASRFTLRATQGSFWTDLAGSPTNAPTGSIAITGNASTLLALNSTGGLFTYNGTWLPYGLTAPSGTQWIGIDKEGVLFAATPTQVYYLDHGIWSHSIPPPPVTIQGLVLADQGLKIWGTDGTFWDFSQARWVLDPVVLRAGTTSIVGNGPASMVGDGTNYYQWSTGGWTKYPAPVEPQTLSTTLALGQLVSLCVK